MTEVEVSELGLAAYLRIKKIKMSRFVDGSFIFETDKTLDQWRTEYLHTDCYYHDKEVMSLRKFKSNR